MERSTVHLLHKRGKSLRTIAGELGRSKSTIARTLSEPVDRQPQSRQSTYPAELSNDIDLDKLTGQSGSGRSKAHQRSSGDRQQIWDVQALR